MNHQNSQIPAPGPRTGATAADTGTPYGMAVRPYVLPSVSLSAVRQMDVLAAVAEICTAGRSTVKIGQIMERTGLERTHVHPTLRFLTASGLLVVSPAGWTPTTGGRAAGRLWPTDRPAARQELARTWRTQWMNDLLLRALLPRTAVSAETLAGALRPVKKAPITPWMQLVDWLILAELVTHSDDGAIRLAPQPASTPPPAPEPEPAPDEYRGAAPPPVTPGAPETPALSGAPQAPQPAPTTPPSPPAPDPRPGGLVLPLTVEELAKLPADDYGAIMRAVATIYEVLSRRPA
ncbi:hypothetical protein [Kitasatospora aureofaciens]|uniref:hypothetical protein n=1 Tax=Kitasatospora aureofaciens TaxID=1894 RepID=UPI00380858D3